MEGKETNKQRRERPGIPDAVALKTTLNITSFHPNRRLNGGNTFVYGEKDEYTIRIPFTSPAAHEMEHEGLYDRKKNRLQKPV